MEFLFQPSNIEWCEENYVVTSSIAEFYNSLSSLSFCLCGLYGFFKYLQLETKFMISFLSLLFVGIGSFTFHSTLTFIGQALDEISMVYTIICFYYTTQTIHNPKNKEGPVDTLIIIAGIFTMFYFFFKDEYLVFFLTYSVFVVAT